MGSSQTEVKVSSWNELTDKLYENSWNPQIGRFRSDYVFRGSSDSAQTLTTGLQRLGGEFARMERHLLRNFIKYASNEGNGRDTELHWLGLAQHHGLPTRLLDWSYSPYVAMHFATARMEKYDVDGVIWCINYVEAHRLLPEKLRRLLEEEDANAFTSRMLESATEDDLRNLDALSQEPFVLFYEPLSLDKRIVNQYALFSLMNGATADLSDWLTEHPDIWQRVIVPASLKWEIRDKLDQANITERVLFPNLDGLCSWLRRMYGPRD